MKDSDKKKIFNAFEDEAKFWIDVLGLKEWRIEICLTDAGKDRFAQCGFDCSAKASSIELNEQWLDGKTDCYEGPSDDRARISAFHEVLELMLAEIEETLISDPRNEQRIESERHRIIRRLENVLYPLKPFIGKAKNG